LVSALLARGAKYLSDELALLDDQGRVHAYPKPLSVRAAHGRVLRKPAPLGSLQHAPLPLGLVVSTSYRKGASFRPHALPRGQAALALLQQAFRARQEPHRVLEVIATALADGHAVHGVRGPADRAAEAILALCKAASVETEMGGEIHA
jgi:hypothetical protein